MPEEVYGVFKFTIRSKLLIVCSVLLLVPILSLGWVAYQVSGKETNALIESGLKNNVKMAGQMLTALDKAVKEGSVSLEEAQENLKVSLLGAKNGEGTRPINPEIDLGPNGYFFILDNKGNLLAHPLLEGKNIWDKQTSDGTFYIQDMIKTAEAGGGFTYYNWPLPNSSKEALKVSYAELEPSWGWIIAAGSYMQDYDGGQRNIVSSILITLAVCLVVGMSLLTWFSFRLSKPIVRMAQRAERMAEGDLTGEKIKVSSRDEIGRLAASFDHLNDNLRELAGNQLHSANELAASSSNLSNKMAETVHAVNETSQSISEVASLNDTQAGGIEETSKAMEEMAKGIQRIATTSTAAFDASEGTLKEAEHGHELIRQSTAQMSLVNDTVGELSTVIRHLEGRSQQIGKIAATLQEISSQTNLLALNASIEAARAGEYGQGFTVVAKEIRKLAERSNESAAQVTELIEAIQRDMGDAVTSMKKGELEVEAGVAVIRQTGEAFMLILEATRSVVQQVEEASSAVEQMSASSEEITAALMEMQNAASQTAGASQNVSATVEEQLAQLDEIASSAERLSQMSDDMKQMASRFKI